MRNDTDYISLLPTNMPRYLFFSRHIKQGISDLTTTEIWVGQIKFSLMYKLILLLDWKIQIFDLDSLKLDIKFRQA